jgi:hypothetical protein
MNNNRKKKEGKEGKEGVLYNELVVVIIKEKMYTL